MNLNVSARKTLKKYKKSQKYTLSPYSFCRTRKKSPVQVKPLYKDTANSHVCIESVNSTRDHSSKRSNTPVTQSLNSRKGKSFAIRMLSNQNDKAVLNKSLKFSQDFHKKILREKELPNEKNIKNIMENYGYHRPKSSFSIHRQRSSFKENRESVREIAKFFEEFHEKSKLLLSQFEKKIFADKVKLVTC